MEQEVEKELVLVEALVQYRMRYIVEVPKEKSEWALDTVTSEQAKETSQKYLGETIISSRVLTEEEALQLILEDNNYVATWTEEQLKTTFITKI